MPKKTVVTRQEFEAADEREESDAEEFNRANPEASLFAKDEVSERKIDYVSVHRKDPDEGFLGTVPSTATEQDIVAKWGGSEYEIQAKNSQNQIVTRKRVRLAGDPIFVSEIAEARWRRANGLKPKKDDVVRDQDALSIKELLLITRQEESERRAREREEQRTADERRERDLEARRRDEREAAERERERDRRFQETQLAAQREHETKLEEQRRIDLVRRESEHAKQLEAERAAASERIQQSNQFFTNMLAMVKAQNETASNTDPVAMMVSGMEMAMRMKEGEAPKDVLHTILERLPETLAEARETARAAYSEIKRDDAPAAKGKPAGEELTLRGPLASKVKAVARHLLGQGLDPEKVISQVADNLLKARRTIQANAPRAAAEAQANRAAPKKKVGRPRKVAPTKKEAPSKKLAPSKTKGGKEAAA